MNQNLQNPCLYCMLYEHLSVASGKTCLCKHNHFLLETTDSLRLGSTIKKNRKKRRSSERRVKLLELCRVATEEERSSTEGAARAEPNLFEPTPNREPSSLLEPTPRWEPSSLLEWPRREGGRWSQWPRCEGGRAKLNYAELHPALQIRPVC